MGALHAPSFVASPPRADGPNLRIHVIYTTPKSTQASLTAASLLAQDLDAKLELLVPVVVPYPLPLQSPTTTVTFAEESLVELVRQCGVEVHIDVVLCRDREETVPGWLPAQAIAVIGRARRWGRGSCRRLIRAIERNGNHVVVVDARSHQPAVALLCGKPARD
jgi:hypothetical protein